MNEHVEHDFRDLGRIDRLVQTDPGRVIEEARAWLTDGTGDARSKAVAWAALGRALFEFGQVASAADALRRSLAACSDVGDATLRLSVAMSASAVFAEEGAVDEALVELDRVEHELPPEARGRVITQRAYVLHHSGQLGAAIVLLDQAEPLLRRANDSLGWLRLLVNRGLVQLQQGRYTAAESDLRIADGLADRLGQTAMRAGIASNLGVIFGRVRRIRDALAQFDIARRIHEEAGQPGRMVAVTEVDRAEALMHAGLAVDAVAAAVRALRYVEPTGNLVMLGDGQHLLARAYYASGDLRMAERTADLAAGSFRAAGRRQMVAHARAIGLNARMAKVSDVAVGIELLEESSAVVSSLEQLGWEQQADELRMTRIRTGHRLGLVDQILADRESLRLGAFSGQRDAALAGWYVEAMCRSLDGDDESAQEACRSGLDRLDDIVAEAPTLERRSAAMRLGEDLSQMAIDLAVRQGDGEIVFAAAEGTRARALHDELVATERHKPLSAERASQLRRELSVRLGGRVLVEWVLSGSRTWAVVVDQSGSRLIDVGDAHAILRARDRVLVWLDRASVEPDGSSQNALHGSRLLDELVIGPLGLPDAADVILVPVGGLHGIPWSGLPSLASRSVTLAPNAQLWLEADRRAGGAARSVGLIVGPGVEGADVERMAVERTHPGAAIAAGAGATAKTVQSMFAGLDVVHVAAHGVFRSDHPLMSTMRLHDGDMTLYDTVPVSVGSRLVILSSCEGGAQGTADGSEVLGLASVMLARGAAAVLAPLTAVRELECADFVAEVHDEFATGASFGLAVSAVRQRWLGDDDLSRWAVASSFTCFGSGSVTITNH